MKFNFKIQEYQTDAVDAVVRAFNGQPHYDKVSYIRDLGKQKANQQMQFAVTEDDADLLNETGYKNEAIELTDGQLLDNIKAIQNENNIKVSDKLIGDVGRCSLDIEMETGTGKTYVYIMSTEQPSVFRTVAKSRAANPEIVKKRTESFADSAAEWTEQPHAQLYLPASPSPDPFHISAFPG